MCSESDFDKWKNGELYYCQEDGKFYDDAGRSKLIKEQIIHSKAKYNDGKYTYKDVDVLKALFEFTSNKRLEGILESLAEVNGDHYTNYLIVEKKED